MDNIKRKGGTMNDELEDDSDDVIEDEDVSHIGNNELDGGDPKVLLSIRAVLETCLKPSSIDKVCGKVFGNWEWMSNIKFSRNSCRIILGWNDNIVKVNLINSDRQSMFCFFEMRNEPISWYGTIIYASNSGKDRRLLWKELIKQSVVTKDKPWIEVEDFGSTGFHYTWTKSLKNPNCGVLKNLDRILVNEAFLTKYPQENGRYMPYLISDHSPAILEITSCVVKQNKSFRFMNYVAYKEEFLETVEKVWANDVPGYAMYQVVKKMKNLKGSLNRLNWKNGDIHLKVKHAKAELKEIQKQKAKIDWIKDGDKNTKYFHSIIKSRSHKSRVNSICDEDGNRVYDDQVAVQCVKHFEKFLGEFVTVSPMNVGIFTKKVPAHIADRMVEKVTDVEIKGAIFDIDINKASGPDGYTSCFFRKAWSIVEIDVCASVKEFFRSGKLLGEINATLIALIPKVDTPNKVSDFRPIACCNMLYKCINKILTNIIKEGLDLVVGHNQTTFILGRSIHDNIMVTQELLKGYNRANGPSRCAMKIDIQKAYDTVFMVFFKGGRGLRQGDLISPYLFTLVVEVFSLSLADKIKNSLQFRYHHGCKNMELTHISFADDLLVLCHGDEYLVKSKIKSTIRKTEKLSYAGRLMLVNSALSSMHVYWASVFILPAAVLNDIEKLLKGFLWCQEDSARGKAKVAWKTVCTHKDLGGLGLKPMKEWNEVLILKQLWKIVERKESLWYKWVNTVKLKGRSIWDIQSDYKDSWNWGQLLKLREKIKEHVHYYVGNGKQTSFWYDEWDVKGPIQLIIPRRERYSAGINDQISVHDFNQIYGDHWPNEWRTRFPMVNHIQIPVINDNVDMVKWVTNDKISVDYSTKQVRRDLRVNGSLKDWYHVVWFKQLVPKHAFILWLVIWDRLPTQERISKWKPTLNSLCPLCGRIPDSVDHLFFKCCYSRNVWKTMKSMILFQGLPHKIGEIITVMSNYPFKNQIWSVITRLVIAPAVYYIWQERNKRLFKGEKKNEKELAVLAIDFIRVKLLTLKVKQSKKCS
ncbi:uncharacterized protein [Rutidosis leptorrhynchoides]|uniref:uncharacterized protein n=1 Tax=Rutidosis leptorrhynchoides TaxID=125765 RepID=UPI003A9A0C84